MTVGYFAGDVQKSLSKIMQINFGRGELCENFFASVPFLFTVRAQSGQDQK